MIQFSVIVPFHNEAMKLPAFLKSIKELDFDKSKVEFIFVSNNSTDESDSLVRAAGYQLELANRLSSSYYARNIGLSAASGEYVVFVDADCILDKNILKAYTNHINKKKSIGPTIYAGDIQPAVLQGTLVETYSATRRVLNQSTAASGWAYKPFAQTANAMFSRRDLVGIHGFKENMTSGGDAEICWRLSEKFGHQVVFCSDAIVYHKHRETIEDLINQFMKYGRGRFQQALVSESYAKNKKPNELDSLKNKSAKVIEDLLLVGAPKETIFKLMDLLTEFYFNIGFLDELITTFNSRASGTNYEFITCIHKKLPK